jgi:hypothetical protein
VPTRVQVFAKGESQPAFQVGFTSFDPSRPSANLFRFNPPPGTKVTESTGRPQAHGHVGGVPAFPNVVGHGWTSVVVAKAPAGAAGLQRGGGSMARMLGALPEVSGSWGSGHLLKGSLFSVLLTNDGRVVAGTVPPRMLYGALAAR